MNYDSFNENLNPAENELNTNQGNPVREAPQIKEEGFGAVPGNTGSDPAGKPPAFGAEPQRHFTPVSERYSAPQPAAPPRTGWSEPAYRPVPQQPGGYSPSRHVPGAYNQSYYPNTPQKKQEKKKSGFWRGAVLVLVCAIICSALSISASYFVTSRMMENWKPSTNVIIGGGGGDSEGTPSDTSSKTPVVTGDTLAAWEIYEIALQQVVGVRTTSTTTNVFNQTSTTAVSGSGFIISTDGYIMTNYHVIEYAVLYGDSELTVIMSNEESYHAEIIGYEKDNDIAVIKIDATGLNAATFGDSDTMRVGDDVYAVGNPLGELTYTMTDGMVSALDRAITTDSYITINMFQINAAVNSGNSGGPVYNAYGEIIGVVTAKYSETGVEGLGFAIPINDAYNIAAEVIEHGYVTGKAYLGIIAQDMSGSVSEYFGSPNGAYIRSMEAGSCAEEAGLKVGDVIIGVDDTEVASLENLKTALRSYKAGDTAEITVYRSGEELSFTVVFDEAPPSNSGSSTDRP